MLYIGEEVGRRATATRPAPRIRHRGRPARGHEPRGPRPGRRDHGSRGVRGGRPPPRPRHLPGEAVRRAGRHRQGRHPRSRRPRTCGRIAAALGRGVNDITVVILERPRHEALINEVRAAGARIKLITDGDLSAAISCAVQGTGVHAVMGIGGAPGGRAHRRRPALPRRRDPGPLPVSQRSRSGRAARRWATATRSRVYLTEDLASGENLVFAATGVTTGDLLQGVRYLRRRCPDPLADHGLPVQAGPLRRHGPHVRSEPAAVGPAVGLNLADRHPRSGSQAPSAQRAIGLTASGPSTASRRRRADSTVSRQPGGTRCGCDVCERREDEQPLPGEPMRNDEVGRLRRVGRAGFRRALDGDPVTAEDE